MTFDLTLHDDPQTEAVDTVYDVQQNEVGLAAKRLADYAVNDLKLQYFSIVATTPQYRGGK